MTLAHLVICTGSIYASFILWALLQERLTTTPYTLPLSLQHATTSSRNEYFQSPLALNALQALFSTTAAAVYLIFRSSNSKDGLAARMGLNTLTPSGARSLLRTSENGKSASRSSVSPLLLRYIQISASQSISSLLALHSLSHGISYPTLTLAKSCKLVPVLFANVLLYRRRFAPYKYVVVLLVTVGISMFMLFGDSKKKSNSSGNDKSSLIGLSLLLANQALDGITNSTQDQVFATYSLSGPKMMLMMNAISTILMGTSLIVPVPAALGGNGKEASGELATALAFIHRHPEILRDLFGYAVAGALGQIAIFETLERFGSLTLVAITVSSLFSCFFGAHSMSH